MYRCISGFISKEGFRFNAGEKIAYAVYYRMNPEDRKKFMQDFGEVPSPENDEAKNILPKYEGGFNAGQSGFSTGHNPSVKATQRSTYFQKKEEEAKPSSPSPFIEDIQPEPPDSNY